MDTTSQPAGHEAGAGAAPAVIPAPVIAASEVSKAYHLPQGPLPVLEDVSVAVGAREIVSIVGASGCGKSTLLKILGGLVAPDSGEVRVEGEPVTGPSPDRVAVVFQEDCLLPWYRIRENVGMGLAARGVRRAERKPHVDRTLETVGLTEFAQAFPHELSGGMRQRAALARALVMEPRVLLLDEPFAALDEQTRNLMGQELRSLHARIGGAMVMVTHSLTEAVLLSDRVVAISSRPGRIRRSFAIDLPDERPVELIDTAGFAQLRHALWKELEEDWLQSGFAQDGPQEQPGERAGA